MDGDALARALLGRTAARARSFTRRMGRPPGLAVVLMGEDARSSYPVGLKQARCDEAGLTLRVVQLPWPALSEGVRATVSELSADPSIDGVLVQYPLAPHLDQRAIIEAVVVDKDVDGATALSRSALVLGVPGFRPCAAIGIMLLLDHYAVDPKGTHAVMIDADPELGVPTGMLLRARKATVTYCRWDTEDLPSIARTADLIISSSGHPKSVRGSWLKPGAVVIDASYDNGTVGDVDLDEAVRSAGLICPVPGGVGPMTIAVLLDQTVAAAERRCLSAGKDEVDYPT
jgi:methylenetetrahydrofolate dehydrogenase (NADP+) / methenyltetrahydrofolate cyclohydrolase